MKFNLVLSKYMHMCDLDGGEKLEICKVKFVPFSQEHT